MSTSNCEASHEAETVLLDSMTHVRHRIENGSMTHVRHGIEKGLMTHVRHGIESFGSVAKAEEGGLGGTVLGDFRSARIGIR